MAINDGDKRPSFQALAKGRRTDIIGVLEPTGSGYTVTAVNVTDAVTPIPTTNMVNRKGLSIMNVSSSGQYIEIGDSNVTYGTGWPILPYGSQPFAVSSGAQLYAIANTGETVPVRVLEINNS